MVLSCGAEKAMLVVCWACGQHLRNSNSCNQLIAPIKQFNNSPCVFAAEWVPIRPGVPSVPSSACSPCWTSCIQHRACPEVWAIAAHNKEHKEHCFFFADSIWLYLYKTLVSIQCLKEVLQSCSTLCAFCLNMTKLQAMPWASHPVRPINFPYPAGFVYLSVQLSLIELNY